MCARALWRRKGCGCGSVPQTLLPTMAAFDRHTSYSLMRPGKCTMKIQRCLNWRVFHEQSPVSSGARVFGVGMKSGTVFRRNTDAVWCALMPHWPCLTGKGGVAGLAIYGLAFPARRRIAP